MAICRVWEIQWSKNWAWWEGRGGGMSPLVIRVSEEPWWCLGMNGINLQAFCLQAVSYLLHTSAASTACPVCWHNQTTTVLSKHFVVKTASFTAMMPVIRWESRSYILLLYNSFAAPKYSYFLFHNLYCIHMGKNSEVWVLMSSMVGTAMVVFTPNRFASPAVVGLCRTSLVSRLAWNSRPNKCVNVNAMCLIAVHCEMMAVRLKRGYLSENWLLHSCCSKRGEKNAFQKFI